MSLSSETNKRRARLSRLRPSQAWWYSVASVWIGIGWSVAGTIDLYLCISKALPPRFEMVLLDCFYREVFHRSPLPQMIRLHVLCVTAMRPGPTRATHVRPSRLAHPFLDERWWAPVARFGYGIDFARLSCCAHRAQREFEVQILPGSGHTRTP